MLYGFTIHSWHDDYNQQFILEASDLLDAHMRAIDWVEKLEAALDTVPTRSPNAMKTVIVSVHKVEDTEMANDKSIDAYLEAVKERIKQFSEED